jgi:hypothetical protein
MISYPQHLKAILKPSEAMKEFGLTTKEIDRLIEQGIFKKGIHFNIPKGRKYRVWITAGLWEWATSPSSDEAQKVLDKILS